MRINNIPVTVDMLGAGLVVCVINKKPGNEEAESILEKRLCELCGGRKMNDFERATHPLLPDEALLFTYDAWRYTVPHFNNLTR